MAAFSARTRKLLDWAPAGLTLVEDILAGGHGTAP